jgi:hypothetical protein
MKPLFMLYKASLRPKLSCLLTNNTTWDHVTKGLLERMFGWLDDVFDLVATKLDIRPSWFKKSADPKKEASERQKCCYGCQKKYK